MSETCRVTQLLLMGWGWRYIFLQCFFAVVDVTCTRLSFHLEDRSSQCQSAARAVRFYDVVNASHASLEATPTVEHHRVGVGGGRQGRVTARPPVTHAAGPCPRAAVQELVAIGDGERADGERGGVGRGDLVPEVETPGHR